MSCGGDEWMTCDERSVGHSLGNKMQGYLLKLRATLNSEMGHSTILRKKGLLKSALLRTVRTAEGNLLFNFQIHIRWIGFSFCCAAG